MREASFSLPEDEAPTRVGYLDARPTRTWEGALFSRLMNDVEALPRFEASRPVSVAPLDQDPNVFEEPRLPTDPPPIWEVMPARPAAVPIRRPILQPARPQSRASAASLVLPVLFAVAGAATALLCLDASARAYAENTFGVLLALVM